MPLINLIQEQRLAAKRGEGRTRLPKAEIDALRKAGALG